MPGARELTAAVFTMAGNVVFCPKCTTHRISFLFALHNKKAQTPCMTTVNRSRRLCGWSIRCASALLALAFCASAFADPSKNVVLPATQQPVKSVKKLCYVMISGFGVPQPCDRLASFPTTVYPMDRMSR